MIQTPMTKAALKLCFEAHKDQVDKAGLPYVYHPFFVAEYMTEEAEACVALLHDVMEDTGLTADDIRNAGMSEEVVEALLLLTHDPSVPYMDYVRRLSANDMARKVKMMDLVHNMDLGRLDVVTERDLERREKYREALGFLAGLDGACNEGRPLWDVWDRGERESSRHW